MYRRDLVLLCVAILHFSLCYGEVDMAGDPILEYFKVDPKTVMEHELINIEVSKNIDKRSTEENRWANANIRIRTFNNDINMWLHPRDSLLASVDTPVLLARVKNNVLGKVAYYLQSGAMRRVGHLFENDEHRASLVIGSDPHTNEDVVTGRIQLRRDNADIIIRPVPAHIVEKHLRKRRSTNKTDESSSNAARHVAMRIKDNFPDYSWIFATNTGTTEPPNLVRHNQANHDEYNIAQHPNPHSSPVNYSNSIYPKLFLHFDYTYFGEPFWDHRTNEFDMTRFLEYVLAFWNGVDLSYRHLENPSIKLHIAGIAVATAFEATPYIEDNTPRSTRVDRRGNLRRVRLPFRHEAAVTDAQRFFYNVGNQIPLYRYDVAVTLTRLKMGYPRLALGAAIDGGACKVDENRREQWGIALVHDNSAFGGIDTAVHELAHTFGVDHDVGDECGEKFGYIMTGAAKPTAYTATFSSCSQQYLNRALNSGKLKCMYNPPAKKNDLPKLMPGKMKTLDEQCQAESTGCYCHSYEVDLCARLTCLTSEGVCKKIGHGAAPGTPCGNDINGKPKVCISKQCVSVN